MIRDIKEDKQHSSEAVTVLILVEKRFSKNYLFWNASSDLSRFTYPEIIETVIRKIQLSKHSIPCYFSLGEFEEESVNIAPYSALTVISIPKQNLIGGDGEEYFIKENTSVEPYQIQYSLLLNSEKDLYPGEAKILMNPLYESLSSSCYKNSVKGVIEEIFLLFNKNAKASEEKNNLMQSLKKSNDLNMYDIYKVLSANKFSSTEENLLTQCMLNMIAASFVSSDSIYIDKLSSRFLLNFPRDIAEIIFQYQVPEEIKNKIEEIEDSFKTRRIFDR